MTQHWRGDPERQTAASKWLRGRWKYGSLKVLDLDCVIVSNDYNRGMLAEFKHVSSANKTWYMTRVFAERLGFYGALILYDTDDGTPHGNILDDSIRAIVYKPNGEIMRNGEAVDVTKFDKWVEEQFGD